LDSRLCLSWCMILDTVYEIFVIRKEEVKGKY
jgi:hypothetical protein